MQQVASPERPASARAGGLRRIAAFGLDYLLIAAYLVILAAAQLFALAVVPGRVISHLYSSPLAAEATGFAALTLPVVLYFALSEASTRQATLGKRALGLIVTDLRGRRLSLLRSFVRSAIKFAPWELAHAMIYQITFNNDSASRSPALIVGFATVYLLVGAYFAMLFIGSRRTPYDRLTGTCVARVKA